MRIHQSVFSGERPKQSVRNLGPTEAQEAFDCELVSDELRPLRNNLVVDSLTSSHDKTLFEFDGNFLSWAFDVDVVESPVDGAIKRIFYTGDGLPKQADSNGILAGISYNMGVPKPLNVPTVIVNGTPDEELVEIDTFYVYTFVNAYGEEGDKSEPSNIVTYTDGQTFSIGNLGDASNPDLIDYNITLQRLYRIDNGVPKFIAEFPYTDVSYIDSQTLETVSVAGEFSTEDFRPPPPTGVGLHLMANGVALMFELNTNIVHVSEPYQLNAWPYTFSTESEVVGISSFDNNAVILTKGYPEIATIFDPRNISTSILADREPCVAKRGIVQGAFGVIYPAPTGAYFVGSSGGQMLTQEFYDKHEWEAFEPSTMTATFRDGQYIGFFGDENKGFGWIYDTREENAVVRRLTQWASAVFVREGTDDLFLIQDKSIALYQGGTGRLNYRWKGKMHGKGSDFALTCRRLHSCDFDANPSDNEITEIEARIAQGVIDAAAQIALRSSLPPLFGIGGALAQDTFGGCGLTPIGLLPAGSVDQERGATFAGDSVVRVADLDLLSFCDLTVYGDKQVIHEERVTSNQPDRLNYADRKRLWEFEYEGNAVLTASDFAGSIGELFDGS